MLRELLSSRGPYRILNFAWLAFFLTFVVWFNYAPFATIIREEFHLTVGQSRTIALCNLALTIPARIAVGMILDYFGPRLTFSAMLIYAAIPCWAFAAAQTYDQLILSRLAMGIVGAGFVVGIRLVAEWFEAKQMGFAQGIYGGWGNAGSFAAEAMLPMIALASAFLYGGHENWRFTIAFTGVLTFLFGILFYKNVQDTPPGKEYQRPERNGGMEVTSRQSFLASALTNIPILGALALIAWRLQLVKFLTPNATYVVWAALITLFVLQTYQAYQVNFEVILGQKVYLPGDRYQIGQVFLLELAYAVSFGSELAVVSMLPEYFGHTFNLAPQIAGLVAATYPLMNLVSRPAGGLISDKLGSRKWTLTLMLGGLGLGYMVMSQIGGGLPLSIAMLLTMCCAFFVFGGAGATFGIAPLIKRQITGQIAGNVGAYGSVGSVIYVTAYSLLPQTVDGNRTFFQFLGITGIMVAFLCAFLLKEPKVTKQEIAEAAMVAH